MLIVIRSAIGVEWNLKVKNQVAKHVISVRMSSLVDWGKQMKWDEVQKLSFMLRYQRNLSITAWNCSDRKNNKFNLFCPTRVHQARLSHLAKRKTKLPPSVRRCFPSFAFLRQRSSMGTTQSCLQSARRRANQRFGVAWSIEENSHILLKSKNTQQIFGRFFFSCFHLARKIFWQHSTSRDFLFCFNLSLNFIRFSAEKTQLFWENNFRKEKLFRVSTWINKIVVTEINLNGNAVNFSNFL